MKKALRLHHFEHAILRAVDDPKRALAILAFVIAVMPLSNSQLLIVAAVEHIAKLL